jgi:hypothetical protein
VHLVEGRVRTVRAEATRVKGLIARSVEFAGSEWAAVLPCALGSLARLCTCSGWRLSSELLPALP